MLAPIGAPLLERSPETGEDINSVTEKGVPGFAPIQDSRYYFNYHHTPADTFDKVNPRELGENAAVMLVTAYALADAETPAPRRAALHFQPDRAHQLERVRAVGNPHE